MIHQPGGAARAHRTRNCCQCSNLARWLGGAAVALGASACASLCAPSVLPAGALAGEHRCWLVSAAEARTSECTVMLAGALHRRRRRRRQPASACRQRGRFPPAVPQCADQGGGRAGQVGRIRCSQPPAGGTAPRGRWPVGPLASAAQVLLLLLLCRRRCRRSAMAGLLATAAASSGGDQRTAAAQGPGPMHVDSMLARRDYVCALI